MRYLILSIRCFFLTETKKKIAILLITILLLGLCISLPIVFVTAANNKSKFENSYLDRDRTRIFCEKNEKIGQAIIDYTIENDKNKDENDIFKNNNKYTIFLWCTDETNLNFDKVYNVVYSLFYLTYKNIMNLKNFSINSIERDIYSKLWNKKYTLDKKILMVIL
ncbi:hypothetical protein [Spiroplasma sp. hyd1]|uniref:hypothetical protein n=1 Tax=Spiroplasma sp. hyd1 TaxID=1609976 RepID=UPI0018DD9016|nr:hypothetical protein [Spiroplasma sp. hyd1]MBH8623144.1 hypothetical protein [Spiroplasma sp. hyd1]